MSPVGLVRGLWAPFRGAAFIARHGLWGYLALPVLANVLVAALAGYLAFWATDRWFPSEPEGWAHVGKLAFAAFLTVPAFLALYPLVSAPFVDLLSEKTEVIVKGGHPSAGFWAGAVQAVMHGAVKSALYLFAIGLANLLVWVTGVGAVLALALGGLFLAFDGFDYPLARRKVSFLGKWRYLFAHPAMTAGYAVSTSFVFFVPFAFVIAPPLAAVGATLAFLDEAADPVRVPRQANPVPHGQGKGQHLDTIEQFR